MEKDRKAEIFSSNADAIERAMDSVIEQIQSSDIDDPAQKESRIFPAIDILLFDARGASRKCALSCKFSPLEMDWLYDIYIYIHDKETQEKIAVRSYFFPKDTVDRVNGTAVHRSDIDVFQMNKAGIASALISTGEDVRSVVARKVAHRYNIKRIKSVIMDKSNLNLWSTNTALALGYTYAGKSVEGLSLFEKDDDLTVPHAKQKINLAKHWVQNSGPLARLQRFVMRRTA